MFFYLLFGALLAFSPRVRFQLLIIALLGLVLVGAYAKPGHSVLAFYTSPYLAAFAAGVVVAKVSTFIRLHGAIAAGALFGGFLLLPCGWGHGATLVASSLIVLGTVNLDLLRVVPKIRSMNFLGDASYSIYLAQVQTVSLASTSIAGLFPAIPPLPLVVVTTGIVVALGLLLNILVERPLLKFSRRLGGVRPPGRIVAPPPPAA